MLLGVVAGVSYLLNSTAAAPGSPGGPQVTGVEFDLKRGESTVLDAIVGRFATGGQLAFHQETGTDNEYLNLVILLGTGLHDSLETLHVDGELTTLTGSNGNTHGWVVSDFNVDDDPHMWVKFYEGTLTQTANATLVNEAVDDAWTSDHRVAGHAYAVVRIKYHEETFGGRIPDMLFGLKGLRLYDWRKDSTVPGGSGTHVWGDQSTYEWTENPAVILYNYKRGIYVGDLRAFGGGSLGVDLNLAKFTAAANLSDESFHYPETDVTVPRYTMGALLRDNIDPQTFTRTCERAMGGFGASPGGVYGPLPAQTASAVMTITDADLQLGHPRKWQSKLPPATVYTRVQGKFTDPSRAWQLSPYGTRLDAAVDTAEGGARTRPVDYPFVNVYETAQMLAEIERRRDRFTASESLVVRPKFMRLEPGDLVNRTLPTLGAITMMVMSTEELVDGSISLALRQWSNTIVPDGGDDFVPLPPPITPPAAPPVLLDKPQSFVVTAIDQTDGVSSVPAFKAVWASITDPTVDRVVIRYYPVAAGIGDAQYVSVPRGSVTSAVLPGVAPNTQYVIQARLETTPGRSGLVYTDAQTVTSNAITAQAEVDDVQPSQLGVELSNLIGLFGYGPGTVNERLDEIEQMFAQQALANALEAAANKSRSSALRASTVRATAGVFQNKVAIAEEAAARAQAITEVLASVDEVIADGFLRFEADVDVLGSEATITAKVKATSGSTFSEAAWILRAVASGGGSDAYFGVLGTFYVFEDVDGTPIPVFKASSGGVEFQTGKFNRLESIAQAGSDPVIVIDGETGFFSITVP